jgi:hypothetical protein
MLRNLETMAMAAEDGSTPCSLPRIAMASFHARLSNLSTAFAIVASPATALTRVIRPLD